MHLIPNLLTGLDGLVAGFAGREPFFHRGLGDRDFLDSISYERLRRVDPVNIDWEVLSHPGENILRKRGTFLSPSADELPAECRKALVEYIGPADADRDTPVFIHFAATGDETFFLREKLLARPLAEQGIASIILMVAYYGPRRSLRQSGFVMDTVSEQFRMNLAVIQEGVGLVRRLEEDGHGTIGLTGISQGGSMAASVAATAGTPLRVAACVAPMAPAPAFCDGVISNRVAWPVLADEYEIRGGSAEEREARAKEALRETMSIADLRNYPLPANPEMTILLGARGDGYVPAESVQALHDHWTGSELRWLPGGHVTAVLLYSGAIRKAIMDAARLTPGRSRATPVA